MIGLLSHIDNVQGSMKMEMQREGWWEYVARLTDGMTPSAYSAQEGEYKQTQDVWNDET